MNDLKQLPHPATLSKKYNITALGLFDTKNSLKYIAMFFLFFMANRWNMFETQILVTTEMQYKIHLFLNLYFSNVEKVSKQQVADTIHACITVKLRKSGPKNKKIRAIFLSNWT